MIRRSKNSAKRGKGLTRGRRFLILPRFDVRAPQGDGQDGNEVRMDAYAVVETGGKQYRIQKDALFSIEKLDAKAGDSVVLDRVLAVSDGEALKIGSPVVSGASVKVEVVTAYRGDKVVSFKKKRRKGYHKKIGHRQELLKLKVTEIVAG
jgi:large subunit ribosomal protein L21